MTAPLTDAELDSLEAYLTRVLFDKAVRADLARLFAEVRKYRADARAAVEEVRRWREQLKP